MKPHLLSSLLTVALASLGGMTAAFGHDLASDEEHPHDVRPVNPPAFFLAQAAIAQSPARGPARPTQAAPFEAFAPRVKVRWDDRFLFVESNGLPAHGMMVGITAWQQQVPLPQNYTGANAWQFPLAPVPSKVPVSIKGRFLRGAIALAVNGLPIFNPQNNRGELSAEIGELDEWGGHCGRADDYHYHVAPLHLQSVVGPGRPIAYALDGYPIHGLTEPDGSPPAGLDAFNGHTTTGLGYHYHASKKYPYVNGGFHGEVVERDGQVDPQPRANPIREALPPLRGAKITGFTVTPNEKTYALQYWMNGKTAAVNYETGGDGSWKFQYVGADGTKQEETYRAGGRPGTGGERREAPRPDGNQPPPVPGGPRPSEEAVNPAAVPKAAPNRSGSFVLRSSAVADGGALPMEYTGDGPGSTLPLEWTGAPARTKSYALIMHHLDREGKTKWYWTLYNIPAEVTHLDKNARGVGTLGASFKGQIGYEPPHSQGPGTKTYVLTLYALSSAPQINATGSPVTGEVLSAAIKDLTLASTDLSVVYSREGATGGPGPGERKPPVRAGDGTVPSTPLPTPRRDGASAPTVDHPNFVVIMGEAQGWTSSSVQMDDAVPGSKSDFVRTPSLEKLAAGGMRFANFYAASPRCTPSRAALFLGKSPAALHMTFVGEGRGGRESSFSETGSKLLPAPGLNEMPEAETTIAEMLKRAGYATAHFGKWHVGRVSPAKHGFEESDGATNNGGPENVENPNPKEAFGMTERGLEFMTRQAGAGKPFYLQVSHYPGRGGPDARPETFAALRQRARSDRDFRLVGAAAVTEDMDVTIGMLLAKLDELGIAQRTYVIYTADHGAQGRNANSPLSNGKGTVWEGGIRVPLIVRGPGIKAGSCTHVQASTVDLFPTLAGLARVAEPMPKGVEGGTLAAILAGAPDAAVQRAREEFVVHFPHYDRNDQGPASALLLGHDKLIHPYETGAPLLFDLSKDPGENHNLAKDKPQEVADLNRRLSDYLQAVNAQMPSPNPAYDPSKAQPLNGK